MHARDLPVQPLIQPLTKRWMQPRMRSRASAARTVLISLAGLGLLGSPVAWASDELDAQNAPSAVGSGPLDVAIIVETLRIEVAPSGEETRTWVPAGRLSAGDELHYTIRVTNPGKEPVTDIVVTKRLPFGVQYIRGSAVGPGCTVEFSIDNGVTFAAPTRLGASANGKRATRKISPSDYTHMRWTFGKPLSPNATALLRFRATFN